MSYDTQTKQDNLRGFARLRAEFSGRTQLLGLAFVSVCIVLGLLILAKTTKLLMASAQAAHTVEKAMANDLSQQETLQRSIAHSTEIADQLKKHNLFAPPATPQNPVKQVTGILGDAAFIDGAWRRAGDRIGDVEVVAVEPTSVTIRWNGSEKVLAPIAAAIPQDSSRSRYPQRSSGSRPASASYNDTRRISSSGKYRGPTHPKSHNSALSAKEIEQFRAKAAKEQADKLQKVLSNKLDSAKKKVSSKVKSTAKSVARPPKPPKNSSKR